MARTTVALLLVATATLPLLAGCVGTAQATAMESRSAADEAAARWASDAQLAQVVGVEGSSSLASMASAFASSWGGGASDFERAGEDEEVGDGRAEVWAYRYLAASKDRSLVVVVDRDGAVLRQGEEGRDAREPTLGEWTVDSDRALALAKEANEGLRKGTSSEHFGTVAVLARDPGSPRAWWIVAGGGGSLSGGGGGFVKLDAVSGEVLESQGGFGSIRDWGAAWG
ncbi:MAG TPA: hypothetical protein VHH36_08380 [Candidatus Thermoplasmatota archaeon]|nr:hypothetical protein [Candidatus Thermoplasmatota archaeon]